MLPFSPQDELWNQEMEVFRGGASSGEVSAVAKCWSHSPPSLRTLAGGWTERVMGLTGGVPRPAPRRLSGGEARAAPTVLSLGRQRSGAWGVGAAWARARSQKELLPLGPHWNCDISSFTLRPEVRQGNAPGAAWCSAYSFLCCARFALLDHFRGQG